MNFSSQEKTALLSVLLLIIAIPLTSALISFRLSANQTKPAASPDVLSAAITNQPVTSPKDELKKKLAEKTESDNNQPTANSVSESQTLTYYGPTLGFRVNTEGHRSDDQTSKVFLGIASGTPDTNPQFILSYLINVPKNGVVSNISLAGLNQGSTYTAYIKGPAQIATSSAFSVKPINNDLGILSMLSGDLNEDNVVDKNDFSILKSLFGTNNKSINWNGAADFDLNGIINTLDLSYIVKNMNKTGAGGPWYSKIGLASLIDNSKQNLAIGGLENATSSAKEATSEASGYWIYVPKY